MIDFGCGGGDGLEICLEVVGREKFEVELWGECGVI